MVEVQEHQKVSLTLTLLPLNQSNTDPYTGDIGNFEGSLIGSNGFRDDGVNRIATLLEGTL